MNSGKQYWIYITAIAFSLFFVLHGVNEQFGLVRNSTIVQLLLYYFVVSVVAAIVSRLLFKDQERCLLFLFILLCIFFFFGAVKDLLKESSFALLTRYSVSLPIIVVLIAISFVVIKRTKKPLRRTALFIKTLLAICLVVELGSLCYNILTHKERQKDLGDIDHQLISNVQVADSVRKPFIFWIVMDEYSGNTALKKRWHYNNPLDSLLRNRGFFSADSAKSPYNYTHYSLVSSLDMMYLKELKEHSIIGFRDIVRGGISLGETNALKLLKQEGYDVHNYTIYNVNGYPTRAHEYFVNSDFKLIDNQTLPGRIRQDIGWKFTKFDRVEGLTSEYNYRLSLVREGLTAAEKAVTADKPSFFMFHYMITHEPFLYHADGSLDTTSGFDVAPEKYVASITYANNVLTTLIDKIKTLYRDREIVIILQGDHGYKFSENDPLFDQEGCSILYSVYCSDSSYSGWNNTFNSVNTFTVLFNKYFHTNLPIQENRSYNLYYR